jgi:tetratricopeptide (TPR) repeat protein
MWNLLISLALGAAVALGIRFGTEFGWVAAVLPGVITAMIAYVVLARRIMKKLEVLFESIQHDVQARRVDKAVQTLEAGFPLARWQFLVGSQLHSNIGILLYIKQDTDAALPHLRKSFGKMWIARAMLGAALYRRKDVAGARAVFEDAARSNKKEGVVWAAYAWVLEKEGLHEDALKVVGRGVEQNPKDQKLQSVQVTLQNGKKLKLGKVYEEQWFQLYLETPPTQLQGPGFRGNRRAIYRG